jgi:hypothetical protein
LNLRRRRQHHLEPEAVEAVAQGKKGTDEVAEREKEEAEAKAKTQVEAASRGAS